jgi:predicted CXXCH cytochrome family protein
VGTKKVIWLNCLQGRTKQTSKELMCLATMLLACLLMLLSWNGEAFAEKKTTAKEIVVVSPPDGSFVTENTAFLAGHVTGVKLDSVLITGVAMKEANGKVVVTDNTFGALVTFKKGINTVSISGGGINKQVKVFYTPGDKLAKEFKPPKGFKRFYIHGKADPMTCTECHRKRRGKIDFKRITPARSNCTTGNCHPKMGKDVAVHGPVGAGVCISCHNPHGSSEPLQMARTGQELCLVCHEAKRKEFDQEVVHPPVEEGCVDCHDPHQSPMRFQLKGDGKRVASLCFNCHEEEIFSKKHQHGPVAVGDCIACHFPHASANETLLIAPLKEGKLCFECHEGVKDQLAMKNTHDPVLEDCGTCHDPHSSENRFQLVAPPKKLCESCHLEISPEVYDAINTAKVQHDPVAKGECTKCHMPHGSQVSSLLKGKGINLCGTCHEDLGYDIAESKNLHGPVQTGSCGECHNVHGSDFSRLLVREFPEEFYTSYRQEKYDLCFGCHNKDVATKKSTTKLTNFRDGDYNLHNFHVNRTKGRSCIACHDPHASQQDKHVRYEVPFGSWSYPIELTATKTGGGCVVGCHAPKEYDRVKAVGKPSN